MQFKNLLPQGKFSGLELIQESVFPQSNISYTINYSSRRKYSNWAHHNQLFQRHPRLRLFEEQWSKTFHHLNQLVSYIFISGLHRNPFVMSRILYLSLVELNGINGMEKSKFGVKIFSQIEKPNVFSWNTMIRFFAATDPVLALNYYTSMLSQETFPDKYTFPFLLQACGARFDVESARQVHSHIMKLVLGHDLYVQNSLLITYMICNSLTDAWSVFNEMPERDIVSWTSLISGLVSQSNYSYALHVFRNLVCDDSQLQPNVITIISMVSACGNLGSINLTKCFHALLEKAGWLEQGIAVVNSLIDAYAKCGDLYCGGKVFDEVQMVKRDFYSWTAIISGFAMHGRGVDALNLFSRMKLESKLEPDAVTFVAVLSACAHSGLVEEGLDTFESMRIEYGVEPDLRHYGCIVDLFSRAGMLRQAFHIVDNMPMEPNLAVLGSLLNGCRLHHNLELGKAILRKIELLKERGGAPVLLSNMHANENQWSEVVEIRKEFRVGRQGKPPGRSWIQIRDGVHEFVARNEVADPQGMELLLVLERLETHSKLL